jgi:hypothetical protein
MESSLTLLFCNTPLAGHHGRLFFRHRRHGAAG